MDPIELNKLLDEAAERGARRALEKVGLHDDHAGRDIQDLRTLIDGWREAKKTALTAFIKWTTIGLLGLISINAFMQFGGKK